MTMGSRSKAFEHFPGVIQTVFIIFYHNLIEKKAN